MSHDAYRSAQARVENPKDAEYRAFTQATRGLIDADGAPDDFGARARALHANRLLWGTLADDCARPDNALPRETRAGIVSLSLWVARFSREALRNRESLAPLVDVNRLIMQGLKGGPAR